MSLSWIFRYTLLSSVNILQRGEPQGKPHHCVYTYLYIYSRSGLAFVLYTYIAGVVHSPSLKEKLEAKSLKFEVSYERSSIYIYILNCCYNADSPSAGKMAKAVYKLFSLVTLVACFYVCNCQCDPAYLQVGGKLTHECTVIYEKLESALVNNKDNLLVLRDTFFSSFHRSPSFLTVTYDFLVTDSDDGITSVLLYSGWSSSPLYSVTDPGVLLALHSGLLLVAFEDADLAVFPKYITLTLDLREDTDENITQLANGTINGNLDYAIQTLTTRVSTYRSLC